jgi:DNA primase catalytic core
MLPIFVKTYLPFMSNFTDDIMTIRELPIVNVVGAYVKLKNTGTSMSGLCPFHNEKTPSLHIFKKTNSFKCFGCGKSGSVIDFVMEYKKLEFGEALKLLAEENGIVLSKSEPNFTSKFLVEQNNYYKRVLSKSQEPLDYLQSRGFDNDILAKFEIGFASRTNDLLRDFLNSKFPQKETEIDAFLKQNHIFFDRITFPVWSKSGRIIGFQARAIYSDSQVKYLNSRDSDIFKKGSNLYALNFAKMSNKKWCVLVEGNFDVIRLHSLGVTNSVAPMGTALTSEQAKLLRQFFDEIVICYDSDSAGKKATLKALEILLNEDFVVKIVSLPEGQDPDSYFRENNEAEQFFENEKLDWIDFLYSKAKNEDDIEKKIEIQNLTLKIAKGIIPDVRRRVSVETIEKRFREVTKTNNNFHLNNISIQYIAVMSRYGSNFRVVGNNEVDSIFVSMANTLDLNEIVLGNGLEGVQSIIDSCDDYSEFQSKMYNYEGGLFLKMISKLNLKGDFPELSFVSAEDFPFVLRDILQLRICIEKIDEKIEKLKQNPSEENLILIRKMVEIKENFKKREQKLLAFKNN